ncbi:MAG TPA: GMC family oxidoreductase [Actinomycetota bacterium]
MPEDLRAPDVVVIGAGGTGAVVAKELAEAGLGVVVLEAGPWHDPQRNFSGLEWEMLNPFDSLFRWGPLDRTLPPWPRVRDGMAALLQTPGVGGNTLHFGANCPRAYIGAIESAWPFRYRELVPYFFKVEETLPVAVPEIAARKDELFIRGCEGAGIEHIAGPDISRSGWRMQPNAILPIAERAEHLRYPAIDGCTQCGECIVGCRNPEGAPLERSAKRGTNVTYAPMALRTKRCEFRTGCFVTRIVTEEYLGGSRARAVRYRTADGAEHEQEARAIVLCAGAIESPRLWLASGLPDRGAVGRYFTNHWFDYVSGVLPEDVNMFEGQTSMVRAEFPGYGFIESQGLGPMWYALATSFGPASSGPYSSDPAGPWAQRGRTWGTTLKRRLEAYRRTLMIVASVDDEAVPSNRVLLADDVADEHNPAPKVVYRPTERTIARRDWLGRRAAEVLIAAGADPDSIHRADAAPTTIHMHGTLRMGLDAATSVVDPDGEAHDVGRLFVADTSVFPDGIGGPNPTLTAQAVATRTAEKIVQRYFG